MFYTKTSGKTKKERTFKSREFQRIRLYSTVNQHINDGQRNESTTNHQDRPMNTKKKKVVNDMSFTTRQPGYPMSFQVDHHHNQSVSLPPRIWKSIQNCWPIGFVQIFSRWQSCVHRRVIRWLENRYTHCMLASHWTTLIKSGPRDQRLSSALIGDYWVRV